MTAFSAEPSVIAAIQEWQDWLRHERRASEHTLTGYAHDLSAFLAFLGEHLGYAPGLKELAGLSAIDFRGSIGLQVNGHDGFAGYMQTIRDAFPDFHNRIDEIIVTDDRAAARLTYTGTHDGPLFDHAATGAPIEYAGVAMFTMAGGKITKVWVLGDRLALLQQIGAIAVD